MSRIKSMWLSSLLVVAVALGSGHAARAQMEGGIPVGATGEDTVIEPLDGVPVKLSAVQLSRPMLLIIFLPTCPDCQAEVPTMNAVFKKLDPKKVGMMAVALRQSAPAVKAFQQRWGCKYPMAGDSTRQIEGPYNIQAVPSFFVLDKGRVVHFEGHEATVDELVNNLNALAAH